MTFAAYKLPNGASRLAACRASYRHSSADGDGLIHAIGMSMQAVLSMSGTGTAT